MKKIIFLTSLIPLVLIGGVVYQNFYKKNSQTYKNSYYSKLAKECEKEKSSKSCCLASVRAMEADEAFLAKDNKCPVGYKREMFKCIGGYQWCVKQIIEKKAISPEEYQKMLAVVIDVDWAMGYKKIEKFYSSKVPHDFKNRGFDHVRIRVKKTSDFSQIERIIDDSLKIGLIPILAFSNLDYEKDPSDKNLEKAVLWWKDMVEKLKDKDLKLSFNLDIEVSNALNKKLERLNLYYEKAIAEIRKTNPKRIIFISPRVHSYPEYLNELKFPKGDKYLMAEWHFWASGPTNSNPRKPKENSPEEQSQIRRKIKIAKDWERKTGIKTWVGAWMPGNYNHGDDVPVPEQVKFSRFVVGELKKSKTPFAINAGKKFYDYEGGDWNEKLKPVLDEILK